LGFAPILRPDSKLDRLIIERRRAARAFEAENGATQFAEHVFHHNDLPVGDSRKAWANGLQ
jgi:hypothetical protein